MRKRVVVTGIGAVTPLGNSFSTTWGRAAAGDSGISPFAHADFPECDPFPVGQLQSFSCSIVPAKDQKKVGNFSKYALVAAAEALEHSQVHRSGLNPTDIGVCLGVTMGDMATIELTARGLQSSGTPGISPFYIPLINLNQAPGHVATMFGLRGPNFVISTACASGTCAIGEAFKLVQTGRAIAMLTGGSDGPLCPTILYGFDKMRALASWKGAPEKASRPFDKQRSGFVLSEGAGILVLEEWEHAKARGAKLLAEIIGYGTSSDAYHITRPVPDGVSYAEVMTLALADAGIEPNQVDYINAHGTSTYYNDLYETLAIKRVFRDHAYGLSISSSKSMLGHQLGAAGAVEAALTVAAMQHRIIPPTINLETPDPELDLDYTPQRARARHVGVAMSNSFGFGGVNASLVLRHLEL